MVLHANIGSMIQMGMSPLHQRVRPQLGQARVNEAEMEKLGDLYLAETLAEFEHHAEGLNDHVPNNRVDDILISLQRYTIGLQAQVN